MPPIHIIAVGRLREPHWKNAAEGYAKRLRYGYDLVETIVKDGDSTLPPLERINVEGERIMQAIKGNLTPICLDEHGELFTSTELATFLRTLFDTAQTPCFIVGGAYGLARSVLDRATKTMSLSPMTFPHELARVLLFEQLYRADAILHNKQYHHA